MTLKREGNALIIEGSVGIEDAWDLKLALKGLKGEPSPVVDLSRLEGVDLSAVQLFLCFVREKEGVSFKPPLREELRALLERMGVLRC
ncbi:MAG: hypothetical protein ACPLTR_04810 [Thermacetogeniaceae bacterium]